MMEFRITSVGDYGFSYDVDQGGVTLIIGKNFPSRNDCFKIFELLKQPGLPGVSFVRKKSKSKIDGATQYSFHCYTRDDVDLGWSGYFPSARGVEDVVRRLKKDATSLSLVGDIEEKPRKASKPPKNRKELISTIARKTGITPVDVGVVIDILIKEMAGTLRENVGVTLRELGTFKNADGIATFKPSSAFLKRLD